MRPTATCLAETAAYARYRRKFWRAELSFRRGRISRMEAARRQAAAFAKVCPHALGTLGAADHIWTRHRAPKRKRRYAPTKTPVERYCQQRWSL